MDKVIHIGIKNKIAKQTDNTVYVCGNSDYTVEFDFDAEWDAFEAKTARFIAAEGYMDVVFTGNVCALPVIENTYSIKVGVFAGNLHTTTPAIISGKKSILCESGTPAPPANDVYHQIMTKMDETVHRSGESEASAAESADRSEASAGDASASAASAYDSASSAAAHEEAAEQIAQNAQTYAQSAESSAVHAAESAVSAHNSSATAKAYEEEAARCAQNAQEAAVASASSANRAQEIADGLYTDGVRYSAQDLTKEEQTQARGNIGAASEAELSRVKEEMDNLAPAGATVGQLFRVAAISEDGKYTMEPVDMPIVPVQDVKLDGTSVVQDGIAWIPNVISLGDDGKIRAYNKPPSTKWTGTVGIATDGTILLANLTETIIDGRDKNKPQQYVSGGLIDYAVKAAMCDGKGAAWTAEEKEAARERMGVYRLVNLPLLASIVTDEDIASGGYIVADLNRSVNVYRIQCIMPNKPSATINLYPFASVDKVNTNCRALVKVGTSQYGFDAVLIRQDDRFIGFASTIDASGYSNGYTSYALTSLAGVNPDDDFVKAGVHVYVGSIPSGTTIKIWGC